MTELDQECLFCRIGTRGEPAAIVFEDNVSVAFLDYRPLFPGHCLLIPRKHYETLSDLPPKLIPQFFTNLQLVARAVETGMEAEGTFVAMNNRISQSVPHMHIHIVPRRRKDGLKGFFWPRTRYKSTGEIDSVVQAIRSVIATNEV